jgi:hypothetical protein
MVSKVNPPTWREEWWVMKHIEDRLVELRGRAMTGMITAALAAVASALAAYFAKSLPLQIVWAIVSAMWMYGALNWRTALVDANRGLRTCREVQS